MYLNSFVFGFLLFNDSKASDLLFDIELNCSEGLVWFSKRSLIEDSSISIKGFIPVSIHSFKCSNWSNSALFKLLIFFLSKWERAIGDITSDILAWDSKAHRVVAVRLSLLFGNTLFCFLGPLSLEFSGLPPSSTGLKFFCSRTDFFSTTSFSL